jgi:hypothetical protein
MGILHGLLEGLFELAAETRLRTSDLSSDYRDDPVYKKKLEELIERNKMFEEQRNRSNSAR